MAAENSSPLNPDLLSSEQFLTQPTEKLAQNNEELSEIKANLAKLTSMNVSLLEELSQCQSLKEELRANQEALRLNQERLYSILGSIDDVVWSIVPDTGQILYLNHATETVYGRPISAFLDNLNLWQEMIYEEDREWVEQSQQALYQVGKQDIEYRIVWPDGEIHWIRVRSCLIRDAEGKALRIDGLTTEITEQKKIREQLRHDSLHDSLTGLPNRTLVMDRIEQAIKSCQRMPDKRLALLFLDLDRFKEINDSLGHLSGDHLLIVISHRLRKCLRTEDTLGRLGGDEFVILLENLTDIQEAITIADRIHEVLKSPILLNRKEIFMSVSIGIVLGGEQGFYANYNQVVDLLRDADIAMYRAKAKGQGKSAIFNPSMHAYVVQRLQLVNDLQRAIERQELIIYYQPIISLASNCIEGFEALIRWQHSEKGLLSPAHFIPIAEETEAILTIDEWVLHHACHQLHIWQEQFPDLAPLSMNVNLSPKHLLRPSLIEILDKTLAETGLEGNALKLEITESFLIENPEIAMEILEQVRQRKIELCLDDFGTGYSSLSYLDCFAFNVLKIDRSFIKRLVTEEDKCEIIQAIVNLGLTLGMNVVAEGVETQVQMEKLRALNCCYGQGYGFFPPLTSEIITTLLSQRQTEKKANNG
jgi:diguanylate cyclase (GGDEF)-like protein/PAS domain S-box-containing protein